MMINILTARFGGPFQWGKGLTYTLNKRQIEARHIHTLFSLSRCPFYQNADIVHTTVPIPFKLWQRPLVFTIHGDYTIEKNTWQRFVPKMLNQADAITTPSQYLRQKLELEKAIVVPNALFPDRFTVAKHDDKDQLNLVSVMGFYFPDKVAGIAKITDMLSKIDSHHFKHTVIGGGQYLDTVKNQVSNTKVNITFTGFLPDPKPFLTASDIFLYYSYHDNFPIVILEAMASGLPVVTNNIGAVNEIIESERDGYIATSDDAYLEYLLDLTYNAALRSKIGQNARRSVETKFSWAKIINSYVEIYKRYKHNLEVIR